MNFLLLLCLLTGCMQEKSETHIIKTDILKADTGFKDSPEKPGLLPTDTTTYSQLDNKKVSIDSLLAFASSLIGVPYCYASMDPAKGLDCSGFINYVFNRFGITVPRSSRDFENYGTTVPLELIKKGDLLLFTGTDSTIRIIGHIGIVTSADSDGVKFIHSTSGKAYGVTISSLDTYYMRRFMRVARVGVLQ